MIATADVVILSVRNIHAWPGEPQANHHETYAERADAPLLVEDVNNIHARLSGIKKDQALPDLFASDYLFVIAKTSEVFRSLPNPDEPRQTSEVWNQKKFW